MRHGPSGASGGSTACNARPVGEAGVDDRRRAIEAQTERRDDALDDPHDRVGVEIEQSTGSSRPSRST